MKDKGYHIETDQVALDRLTNKYTNRLLAEYKKAFASIKAQLIGVYDKYATKGVLTYADMARYNRLDNLFKGVNTEIGKLTQRSERIVNDLAYDTFGESFYRLGFEVEKAVSKIEGARVGLNFGMLNPKVIEAAVMNPMAKIAFKGLKNSMLIKANSTITQGLIQGKSYFDMAKQLQTDFEGKAADNLRIARTEAGRAQSKGELASIEAAEDAGAELVKVWIATLDGRTRPSHGAMDGKEADEDGHFKLAGAEIDGPHDDKLPAGEIINCFMPDTQIEGMILGASKASYSGCVRKIKTAGGKRLSVTINHPILTDRGWMCAHEIHKGCNLITHRSDITRSMLGDVDHENGPARIEDIFNAFSANGAMRTPVITGHDFYGDGAYIQNGKIDIVSLNRVLPFDGQFIIRGKDGEDVEFIKSGSVFHFVKSNGSFNQSVPLVCRTSSGFPGFSQLPFNQRPTLFQFGPFQALGFGASSYWYTGLGEASKENGPTVSAFIGKLFETYAGLITLDEVVDVSDCDFSGHVFDLHALDGYIIANGILSSNCRCSVGALVKGMARGQRRAGREVIEYTTYAEWKEAQAA